MKYPRNQAYHGVDVIMVSLEEARALEACGCTAFVRRKEWPQGQVWRTLDSMGDPRLNWDESEFEFCIPAEGEET